MLHIWLDESDKRGEYYSNFYGGIAIDSSVLNDVLLIIEQKLNDIGLTGHEIKWTKVNEYHLPKYKKVVELIFELLEKRMIKIRIFFHHNQYVPQNLTLEQKHNEYQILYYEFIKNAFGLQYSHGEAGRIQLRLDQMPLSSSAKRTFKSFLLRLNDDRKFIEAGVTLHESDIFEIDSKNELPLQLMDLVLGAMCFRLNNKHLLKPANSNTRGKRTRARENLYKYINQKLRELIPGFNVGVSTGVRTTSDIWQMPYRHWDFAPRNSSRDVSKTKMAQKK